MRGGQPTRGQAVYRLRQHISRRSAVAVSVLDPARRREKHNWNKVLACLTFLLLPQRD